jgi:predicted metal-binding membrane protein
MIRTHSTLRAQQRGDPPQRAFFAVLALLFTVSTAAAVLRCTSMSAMSEMPMPGGWTMSMLWMRMPGQTWPCATASFLGMWLIMMIAMMLPSLTPMLQHYRRAVFRMADKRCGRLTFLAAVGYFFVWTVLGLAAYAAGITLADLEMQQPALSRLVPGAIGIVVLIAGMYQFTSWKRRHLAICREAWVHHDPSRVDPNAAWRHGIQLGLRCSASCAGLMTVLLVVGVMDMRAMAILTVAMTIERLAPAGHRIAQAIGTILMCTGLFLIAHVAGVR